MKKYILILLAVLSFGYAKAQAQLDFPFQGGKKEMADFFKRTIILDESITQQSATGMVMLKFTSNEKGAVQKIVIYYADDRVLIKPIIDALKQTEGKWIIPAGEKTYDFIIPFNIGSDSPSDKLAKGMFQFYKSKSPISATDQIPLDLVTLLPAVKVNYEVK